MSARSTAHILRFRARQTLHLRDWGSEGFVMSYVMWVWVALMLQLTFRRYSVPISAPGVFRGFAAFHAPKARIVLRFKPCLIPSKPCSTGLWPFHKVQRYHKFYVSFFWVDELWKPGSYGLKNCRHWRRDSSKLSLTCSSCLVLVWDWFDDDFPLTWFLKCDFFPLFHALRK
jgi:hypothetical protein